MGDWVIGFIYVSGACGAILAMTDAYTENVFDRHSTDPQPEPVAINWPGIVKIVVAGVFWPTYVGGACVHYLNHRLNAPL